MKDWQYYPTAMIHLNTRNKSATELAAKLKLMGVKNNSFFLALYNPDLEFIDPHSDDLTMDEMTAISIECNNNPWYYLREVARAPALAGLEDVPIRFNRSIIALFWCFLNHVYFILTQPRQTGKSFGSDQLMNWFMGFRCRNTKMNLLTKDERLRQENIDRLKKIYDALPRFLNYKTRDDANNTETLSVKAFSNYYKTQLPNPSKKMAIKVGRGITTPIFHIDEPPFCPNIEITMPAALSSMGAAVDMAKAAHEPYGVLLTTTAGSRDDPDGAYIFDIVQNSTIWSELYYDSEDIVDLERRVRANNRAGAFRIYACFSHTQLGKDDKWLRDELERNGSKGDAADRDFFNIWTSGNTASPLSADVLSRMRASARQPDDQSASEFGYAIRWYIPEDQIERFMSSRDVVVSCDPSDTGGGDDLSLTFIDAQTGKVVAAGNYNETNNIRLARWFVKLIIQYQRTTWIIERRSAGATLIDYLLMFLPEAGIDPFKRLFNWVINDPYENERFAEEARLPMSRRSPGLYDRAKTKFGFATSGGGKTARSELYSTTLKNASKLCADGVHDIPLFQQLSGLAIIKGRIDHRPGEHDDLVIAWLLAHWLLTGARNLAEYGIDPANIYSGNIKYEPKTPQEKTDFMIQDGYRKRITELFSLMSGEENEFVCQRYIEELRMLDNKLIMREGESFSIDSFMKEITENRMGRGFGATRNTYQSTKSLYERMGYNNTIDRRYLPDNVKIM